MTNIFDLALLPSNIFFTGLLMIIFVYWLSVMAGVLDMEFLDFDLDSDLDVDLDAEVDAAGSPEAGVSWLNKSLTFFNLGKVPFMFFLTFLVVPMWFFSLTANYLFHNTSFIISLVFILPNLIAGLIIAKFLTTPFVKLFQKLDNAAISSEDLVGKICTINLEPDGDLSGQAELESNGSHFLVKVKTLPGVAMRKRQTGLLVDYKKEEDWFLVEPYDSPT